MGGLSKTMGTNLATTTKAAQSLDLGRIEPTAAETLAWAQALVAMKRREVSQGLARVGANVPAAHNYPPTLEEYVDTVKRRPKALRDVQRGEFYGSTTEYQVLKYTNGQSTPDVMGYLTYLNGYFERVGAWAEFNAAMNAAPRPVLDPRARVGHTSIVGASNAGKSELMKALALHDIQSGAAVVVIDPHAKLARQIARWPEVAKTGRLVWMGHAHGDTTARFNPLDARGLSEGDKEKAAESLVATLGDLVNDAEPTSRMATMAWYCLRLLMEHEGSTLLTLRDMLTPHGAKEWAARGVQHPSESVAYYFQNEFLMDEKKVTRDGLRNRLVNVIGPKAFTARFCQPSTVDLDAMLGARKVIVFDLYDLTGRTQIAAARLIAGALAGWAKRRDLDEIENAAPVHVYLDEAGPILSAATQTILRETRKMGMYLTLASPDSSADLRKTAVRCAGGSEWKHALADTPAAYGKEDKTTTSGVFWVNWANKTPFKLTVRRDLGDGVRGIGDDAWAKVLEAQRAAYYRPTVARQEATAKAADAAPKRARRKPD